MYDNNLSIAKEQVDQGVDLVETLERVHQWVMDNELIEKNGIEKFAFVTDGYAAKFIKLLVDLRSVVVGINTDNF